VQVVLVEQLDLVEPELLAQVLQVLLVETGDLVL
jgi:hypothetical protein